MAASRQSCSPDASWIRGDPYADASGCMNGTFPYTRRSVGCILAELLYRKPLFPGKDYIHQLKLIIKTLGSPTDEDLEFISIAKGRAFIKGLPRVQVLTPTLAGCDAEAEIDVPI